LPKAKTSNDIKQDLSDLAKESTLNSTNTKLDTANTKLGDVNTKLDTANTKLGDANTKLDTANTKLGDANTKLDTANTKLGDIDSKLGDIKNELTKQGDCVTSDCGAGDGGRPSQSDAEGGSCPYNDIRCSGDNPWDVLLPDKVEGPATLEESYQSFKDELGLGPLGPVLNYQPTTDGGGACPTFTIPSSRYWGDITVDAHCQVYDRAAPIIYRLMT
jgi:uncharacterized phage infection (PIP) family protein YhgE